MEFLEFPKIARLSRECVITEKIDGTNAQINIVPVHDVITCDHYTGMIPVYEGNDLFLFPGSRNHYLTPENDNYGFAGWVKRNAEELLLLGPGRHYGEWWGQVIQRNYGLKEKRFSLFNVSRWADDDVRPPCCSIVPILYEGIFDTRVIQIALDLLQGRGSKAAPGFMNPEGVVIYHIAGRTYFKKTILKDEEPKSKHGGA